MRRLFSIWLCVLLSMTACWAAPTTEGTEFWLTFMRNIHPGEVSLFASARQQTTVTVENPQTHWKASFDVAAGTVVPFTLPAAQCYMSAGGKAQKGLRVSSTADISLFASNYAEYSYDATLVLPAKALGNSYVIQTWEDKSETAELAMVATEDNTVVVITPHARTTDDHVKNVSYSVMLQAGEAYQILSQDEGGDFSGTYIQADHPVAVFAGHACAQVPESNMWCDHLVEQQRPVSHWGCRFALTKTHGQQGNRVMVTAKDNNTLIRLNGTQTATLQALESYSFRLTESSAYLESSAPVACFLYIEGARANAMYGDPSSVAINPFEQRIKDISFATFHFGHSADNYVNVVTTPSGAAAMTLDGKSVSDAFAPLNGSSGMRFASLSVSRGTHLLHTAEDGLVGYVYGMGLSESYAYTLGSATYALQPEEQDGSMIGFPYLEINAPEVQCYKESVAFSFSTNLDYSAVLWDFGDGQTDSRPAASHTYSSPGVYTVTLTLTHGNSHPSVQHTILMSDLFRDTIHADICEGESYVIEGNSYTETGEYTVRESSGTGCDSIVVLKLNVHPTYHTIEQATFPKGGSYKWHDTRYRTAGTYIDPLTSVYGCDSVTELQLTETDATETMYDTICWQPGYKFHNHTYPLPSVEGYEDRAYINYTLCYNNKSTCTTYRMHLAIIPNAGGEYELYDTIQTGQTYRWFGNDYTEQGVYHTETGDKNCLQTYTLHLTVVPFPVEVTDIAMCHEDSVIWRGRVYRTPGSYADTVFSRTGIDKVCRLNLTDNRSFNEISVFDVPEYEFNGRILTESGTYRDTLTNAAGCDSVVTLYLGIMEPCVIRTEVPVNLCEGETMEWNGQICEPGKDYTASFVSSGGCDSLVTLHVTALEKKYETLQAAICEGDYFLLEGTRYTDEGDYTIPLTASNGCDSLLTLQLRYLPAYADTTDTVIGMEEKYMWQGEWYAETGEWTKGFVATNGCDSIEVLRLEVTNLLSLTDVQVDDGCADDGVIALDLSYTGKAHQVRISFDDKAHAAGFRDTVMPMPEDGTVMLPFRARAGHFTGSAALLYGDITTSGIPFSFTLLYPSSVLEQAWNDVIAVLTRDYNGGYDFQAFQWYENGVLLQGENRSYLYRPLVMGAEYSALLTETDGTQMMTCPLIAQPQTDLTLYPTLLTPGQALYCRVSEQAELNLYDACGNRLMQRSLPAGTNTLSAPLTEGIYIVRIQPTASKDGRQYKLFIR